MAEKRPVIIYGANGFSGRLVAEFLREYGVPFIAAGRSAAKIKDVMDRLPGIETADYEVLETGSTAAELAKSFEGAKVVCNCVGPFIYHGPTVAEACLRAGCHYIDIGGEQHWHREASEKWGPKFADRGLLIAPATAFMSTPSDIAARVCVETAAIDTLEILTMFRGIPTFGSTQTIFAGIKTDAYYLEQNRYKPWPRATAYDVTVPGSVQTQLALTWGGFPHPVWYKNHPQVANVRTMGGILDRQLMEGVFATEKHYEANIRPLPPAEQEKMLSEMASSVQAGMPPRENTHVHRTIDVIEARGSTDYVKCIVVGTCAYRQTGLIQAFVAHSLIRRAPMKVGYAAAAEAVGHREIFRALETHGLSKMKIVA